MMGLARGKWVKGCEGKDQSSVKATWRREGSLRNKLFLNSENWAAPSAGNATVLLARRGVA
ncbi:hypothetical protein EYF80_056309 [Liparis tanakae]|uniref:Uncharacterized protein n=1 Tax=Liparis tanakae TaxID=230148 RepID=A0A4Z2EY32_9TELE|nr:hypothetical protein EYF80_056309 [Liparis tanakae]